MDLSFDAALIECLWLVFLFCRGFACLAGIQLSGQPLLKIFLV